MTRKYDLYAEIPHPIPRPLSKQIFVPNVLLPSDTFLSTFQTRSPQTEVLDPPVAHSYPPPECQVYATEQARLSVCVGGGGLR